MDSRTKYFLTSASKVLLGKGMTCPSCGASASESVQRKYLVTTLRRCTACRLQFRTPTTSQAENAAFYQEDYSQGFTTDCPADAELAGLLETGFKGSIRDYGIYVEVLRAAGCKAGARLFEFGCSWGYGSWQFAQQGYEVESYEISKPRGAYARSKLGVRVHESLDGVEPGFDVFFSSHVLEHVPSVRASVEFGIRLLKPGGLFVAFVPNGSGEFRRRDPQSWGRFWGMVHPQFIDAEFFAQSFRSWPALIASDPYALEDIRRWDAARDSGVRTGPLAGPELLLLARKPALQAG